MAGKIVSLFISPAEGAEPISLAEAELHAGKGIVGDHHYSESDTDPSEELTLVDVEQIERANAETGLSIRPEETRRNVITEGISLNDLVDREFTIGTLRARGVELCEPCRWIGELFATEQVSTPKVVAALVGRAGLRARILESGTIRVGDPLTVDSER